MGYATNLIAGYAQELVEQRGARRRRPGPAGGCGIEPRVRVWFNPTLESRYFMLPGIFALLLLVVTSNLSSMAIVREREIGTLEQLNVTPLGRLELILGKLLPYGVIGLIDALDRPGRHRVLVRGAAARQLLAAVRHEPDLPADDARAWAVRLDDLAHAAAGDDDLDVLLPDADDVSLGLRVSDREHAGAIQPLTYLIPLRYFVVILRGIFLKGVGLETLWPQALALFGWGAVILTLAVMRSSKRLA